MSQATSKKKVQRGEPVLPEEHFWKCYSPQNELPLSGACSVALHGLVIGTLLLIMFVRNLPGNVEASQPPRIDVIADPEAEGGGGTGGPGGPGAGPTVPGPLVKVDTTKEALQKLKSDDKSIDVGTKPNNLQVKDPITKPDDSDAVFGAVLSEAQEEVAKAMKVPLEEARMGGVVGGSPGSGGGAGGGDGGGFGTKKGPSSGSDPNGKVLTQVQKRQLRWRIVFADNGKEHVNQLRALRVTLAIPGTLQDFFTLLDLSGPAAKFSSTIGLKQHASKFKFYNVHPPTVAMVAQELRLATVPKYLVIFLPPSMEEELASLEAQYAKGIREDQIDYTVFQIVTRPNGSYGPVVVEQKLKAGAKGQQ